MHNKETTLELFCELLGKVIEALFGPGVKGLCIMVAVLDKGMVHKPTKGGLARRCTIMGSLVKRNKEEAVPSGGTLQM